MFDIGGGELIVILLGVLILFGPDKLPDIMKTIRSGTNKINQAKSEITKEINSFTTGISTDIKKKYEIINIFLKIIFEKKVNPLFREKHFTFV